MYLVTNLVNGKQYIGITTRSLVIRWQSHCMGVKGRPRSLLLKAIDKYGADSFSIEQIASATNWADLQELERRAIEQYGTLAADGRGYNQTRGGEGGGDCSRGLKRSPEHIEAMRKAHTGKIVSAETRKLISEAMARRVLSEESLAALSSAGTRSGRAAKGRKTPWLTEMNKARIGSHLSPEWKAAVSAGVKQARAKRFWSSGRRSQYATVEG